MISEAFARRRYFRNPLKYWQFLFLSIYCFLLFSFSAFYLFAFTYFCVYIVFVFRQGHICFCLWHFCLCFVFIVLYYRAHKDAVLHFKRKQHTVPLITSWVRRCCRAVRTTQCLVDTMGARRFSLLFTEAVKTKTSTSLWRGVPEATTARRR